MIRGVIFDFDGTLSDSIPVVIELLDEVFAEFGIDVDAKKAEPLIGMDAWKIIEEITGIHDRKRIDDIVQRWAKKYVDAVLVENRIKLFDNVKNVLEKLRNMGLRIGISTSIISPIANKFIEHYGLTNYIDALSGADEVERGKPAPDIFIKTADKLNLPPENTIVVGDAEYDILGGKAMGAITVLFAPNSTKNNTIKPDFEITNLDDLIDLIKNMQKSKIRISSK